MKLTNESVAKALGWRKGKSPMNPEVVCWFTADSYAFTLPSWVSSLDAITAEIEARGLKVNIQIDKSGVMVDGLGKAVYEIGTHPNRAALAVARALLAYLKEKP